MAVEFGSVHALDVGGAGLVPTLVNDARGVLEDVGALGQVVDEEVRSRIAGRLVVSQSILVLV